MTTRPPPPSLYEKPNLKGLVRLTLDAVRKQSKLSRSSSLNRLRDYMWLMSAPDFHELHFEFAKINGDAQQEWRSYDYGEGYFYQSSLDIGIHGLRDTEARFEEYELAELLRGLNVFEIGSNCGFLSLKIARYAVQVTGLEINPYLCQIAETTAEKLALENKFKISPVSFEKFETDAVFDAVLSFANHSTYDRNTRQDLSNYFMKCRNLLQRGGLFLFESHAPDFEAGKLTDVIDILKQHFDIELSKTSTSGSFLDVGRSFLVCRAS